MSIKERIEPTSPGCFGFAIAFNPTTETCKRCEFSDRCQPEAYENLQKAAKDVDVADLSRLHTHYGSALIKSQSVDRIGATLQPSYELTDEQKALIETMPDRAAGIARTIYRRIGDPRLALSKRVNPFDGIKPGYLYPLADEILGGSCTRESYKARLRREHPDWTEGTLNTRVSMAIRLFSDLGITETIDGIMRLNACY